MSGSSKASVKKIGLGMALGIISLPWIFSWLTLRRGYSMSMRVVAFSWGLAGLAIIIAIPQPVAANAVTAAPVNQFSQGNPAALKTAASAPPKAPVVQNKAPKWYSGGTLHKATGKEWVNADDRDKLATSADFLASLWAKKELSNEVMPGISSINDLRMLSAKLLISLDESFAVDSARNLNVSEVAGTNMIKMGVVKNGPIIQQLDHAYRYQKDLISASCTLEWEKRGELNRQMFAHCMRTELSAYGSMVKLVKKHGADMSWINIVFPKLWTQWTKRGATKYSMVNHALDGEIDAALDFDYEIKRAGSSPKLNECLEKWGDHGSPWTMTMYCFKQD